MADSYFSPNLGGGGNPTFRVSADGCPQYSHFGMTIDWATVVAAGADVTLKDGTIIKAGQKYLRYGQAMAQITATKKWGPYDPAAADGRQTAPAANVPFGILDYTLVENFVGGGSPFNTYIAGGLIIGGSVWKERLIATTGTASLANGPTFATLLAALPNLTWPYL